jgi:hypothetical protein
VPPLSVVSRDFLKSWPPSVTVMAESPTKKTMEDVVRDVLLVT